MSSRGQLRHSLVLVGVPLISRRGRPLIRAFLLVLVLEDGVLREAARAVHNLGDLILYVRSVTGIIMASVGPVRALFVEVLIISGRTVPSC